MLFILWMFVPTTAYPILEPQVKKIVVVLPEDVFLNIPAALDTSKGLIIASDSVKANVWLIDMRTLGSTAYVTWRDAAGRRPAATVSSINGFRVLLSKGIVHVYFSNQDTLSTLKTGTPEVIHDGIIVDYFGLDVKKGVAYVTSSSNYVVRVPRGGVGEVKI